MQTSDWLWLAFSLLGGGYTLAVVLWKLFEREMGNSKKEILQMVDSDVMELKSQIESKLSEAIRFNNEHVNTQVSEAHRRIDRTQAETNQLLKGVDVDMALLKYKTDLADGKLEKMDGKIDNIQINLGTISITMQKLLYKQSEHDTQ